MFIRKCAQVAAYYMMSDVFDNIVISLCKFTALSNQLDVNRFIYTFYFVGLLENLRDLSIFLSIK